MRVLVNVACATLLVVGIGCNRKAPDTGSAPSTATSDSTKSPTPDEEAWRCYAPELAKDPKLEGDVQVSFEVAPDGQVNSARVLTTSLQNVNVELCIVSFVNKWKLANPTGQSLRGAKYTFRLHPPKK